MRESLAEAQVSAGGTIAHNVSVPTSHIPQFIARADAALARKYPGIRLCAFGHVGDGNMHYNPARPVDWSRERYVAERPEINRIVHDIVVELGIGGGRLPIDPDQIILGPGRGHPLLEQPTDGRPLRQLQVVREPAAVIVNKEHFHTGNFRKRR